MKCHPVALPAIVFLATHSTLIAISGVYKQSVLNV